MRQGARSLLLPSSGSGDQPCGSLGDVAGALDCLLSQQLEVHRGAWLRVWGAMPFGSHAAASGGLAPSSRSEPCRLQDWPLWEE